MFCEESGGGPASSEKTRSKECPPMLRSIPLAVLVLALVSGPVYPDTAQDLKQLTEA